MKAKLQICLFLLFTISCSMYPQWQKVSTNLPAIIKTGYAIDAVKNLAVVCTYYTPKTGVTPLFPSLFKTTNNGNTWSEIVLPFYDQDNVIDISISDTLNFWLATETGRILATTDGGVTWSVQFENKKLTSFMNFIKMFDVNNGIAMGDAPYFLKMPSDTNKALFLKTTNGGKNWEVMKNNLQIFASGNLWRRLDFVSPNVGYFFENFADHTNQGISKTTDGGDTWNIVHPPISVQIMKFFDEHLGLLIYNNSSFKPLLMRTVDGGSHWDSLSLEMTGYGEDIEFIKNNPGQVWLTDKNDLFFSNDTGKTWVKQSIPGGVLKGMDIVFIDDKEGWVLGNSAIFFTSNGGIVDIENEKITIANEYKLYQNYPNPFNPVTTINYQIPKVGTVTLKIFDILGNEVTTLVNEQKEMGRYTVQFDASSLASGMYVYQLRANDYTSTKKMLLLK